MAPPPAPHTRHITKRSPVKAKTYSTSRIFKKTQQKPAEVHGKKNAIWADKQGNVWLRKLVQKQKDEKKKAKEIHPLAKEFNGDCPIHAPSLRSRLSTMHRDNRQYPNLDTRNLAFLLEHRFGRLAGSSH